MADFDVPNTSAKRLSYTFTTDLAPQPTCRSHPKTLRDGHQFSVRRPLYNDLPWIWSRLNSIWKRTSSCKWKKSDETVRKYKKGETEGKLRSKATTATAAVADGGQSRMIVEVQGKVSSGKSTSERTPNRRNTMDMPQHKSKTHRGFDLLRSQTV